MLFTLQVQRLAAEFLSADYLFLAVGVVGGAMVVAPIEHMMRPFFDWLKLAAAR